MATHERPLSEFEKAHLKTLCSRDDVGDDDSTSALTEYLRDCIHGADGKEPASFEDPPSLGGMFLSENHDDVYEAFAVHFIKGDEDAEEDAVDKAKLMKLIKGLHHRPDIPCVAKANGIVSIDLEAARQALETYFDRPCVLDVVEEEGTMVSCWPFKFGAFENEDENEINSLLASVNSLAAFQDRFISLRKPLFSTDVEKSASKGGGGGGGGGGGELPPPPSTVERSPSLTELFSCFLCLTTMVDPTSLPCGHSGCMKCLKATFKKGFNKCPLCKTPMNKSVEASLSVNITIRDTILKLYPDSGKKKEESSRSMETYIASLRSLKDMRREVLQDPHVFPRDKIRRLKEAALELDEEVDGGTHGRALRDKSQGLTTEAIKRIHRRAGVIFESGIIFEEQRGLARLYLENLVRTAVTNSEHRRSRGVVVADDVLAARPLGVTLFGYGGRSAIRHVWSEGIHKVLKQVHPQKKLDPKALSVLNDVISYVLTNLIDRAKELRMSKRRHEAEWMEEDEDACDERAYFYKTFDAKTAEDEGPSFNVRLYSGDKGDEAGGGTAEEGEEKLETPVVYVDARDIQTAVRIFLPGELAKHAVSEGTKAVTKYNVAQDRSRTISSRAGLQFNVAQVGLVADRYTNGFPMGDSAAVYLAAVCEYIAAEVLELSGNAARDHRSTFINCRHVMLAIRNDEELNKMLGGGDADHGKCVIRESGVLPNIHSVLMKIPQHEKNKGLSAFEKRLVQIAQSGSISNGVCYFVDPRTGLHEGFLDNHAGSCVLTPLPLLDALCKNTRLERMQMAQAALTEADRSLMLLEGFCAHDRFVGFELPGWSRPSLMQVHKVRLDEVRREQRSTRPFFACDALSLFVREIGQYFKSDLFFTAEVKTTQQQANACALT